MPNLVKVPSTSQVIRECSSKASLPSISRIKIASSGEAAKSGVLEVADEEKGEEEEGEGERPSSKHLCEESLPTDTGFFHDPEGQNDTEMVPSS